MATNQQKFDDIHRETVTQKGPSRSFLADTGANIDTPLGIEWNIDGNAWTNALKDAYLFDVPYAVRLVEEVAANGPIKGTFAAGNEFLREFGQAFCQGLVRHKKFLRKLEKFLDSQDA